MRCRFVVMVAMLCGGLVLGGCEVSTRARTVARYEPGDRPRVQTARYAGQYALYPGLRAVEGAERPEAALSVHLGKGERFGFRKSEAGVSAVAGDQSVVLGPQQSHRW